MDVDPGDARRRPRWRRISAVTVAALGGLAAIVVLWPDPAPEQTICGGVGLVTQVSAPSAVEAMVGWLGENGWSMDDWGRAEHTDDDVTFRAEDPESEPSPFERVTVHRTVATWTVEGACVDGS